MHGKQSLLLSMLMAGLIFTACGKNTKASNGKSDSESLKNGSEPSTPKKILDSSTIRFGDGSATYSKETQDFKINSLPTTKPTHVLETSVSDTWPKDIFPASEFVLIKLPEKVTFDGSKSVFSKGNLTTAYGLQLSFRFNHQVYTACYKSVSEAESVLDFIVVEPTLRKLTCKKLKSLMEAGEIVL